jgi:Pseudouridylate synthases, 23S RNA-specific
MKKENGSCFIKNYLGRPLFVVHRLDEDTSGIICFAKSESGFLGMKALFQEHELERSYTAVVEGQFTVQEGTWQNYIFENDTLSMQPTTDKVKGELAITHFKVDIVGKKYSQITLTLETGKNIKFGCIHHLQVILLPETRGMERKPIRLSA